MINIPNLEKFKHKRLEELQEKRQKFTGSFK